jgi:hypothetical protein
MRAVAKQPAALRCHGKVNLPMTVFRVAKIMIKHMRGAAVIPLMIADQGLDRVQLRKV